MPMRMLVSVSSWDWSRQPVSETFRYCTLYPVMVKPLSSGSVQLTERLSVALPVSVGCLGLPAAPG